MLLTTSSTLRPLAQRTSRMAHRLSRSTRKLLLTGLLAQSWFCLACRDAAGPTGEPMTLRILATGPADGTPLLGPEIDTSAGQLIVRHSVILSHSGWITRAILIRRH